MEQAELMTEPCVMTHVVYHKQVVGNALGKPIYLAEISNKSMRIKLLLGLVKVLVVKALNTWAMMA